MRYQRTSLAVGSAALGAGYVVARRDRPPWIESKRPGRRAGRLHVTVVGDGPPLLLLHGLVGSGRFWGAEYDVLARNYRLVVPDLLGFGQSDRPDHGYGRDDHADAVIEGLDALGITEPAIVGAHSLGTVIALRLAARHPQRVARITAFGPPLYRDRAAAKMRIGAASPMAKLFVLPGSIAERSCEWVCAHRRTFARVAQLSHPRLPPALAADAVEHTWRSYSETLDRCLLTGDPAADLSGIRVPVRLIAGDHDRVVDHDFLREAVTARPEIGFEVWKGDHRLPLTAPARCIAELARRDNIY